MSEPVPFNPDDEDIASAFHADLQYGLCDVEKMEELIAAGQFRPSTVAAFREAQRRLATIHHANG